MSALGRRVLDLAEQQGLLDGKAIAELRKQVAESKFVISPEAIAKVLVDHGHLTAFQARRLVSQALGPEPDPVERRVIEKQRPRSAPKKTEEDLTFADEAAPPPRPAPEEAEEVIELEPIEPVRPAPGRDDEVPALADPSRPLPRKKKDKPQPPAAPAPVDGSTADDFVELEPIDAPRASRGARWKTDAEPSPLNETVEMSPLELPPVPLPGADDGETIEDLFAGTSLGEPAASAPAPTPLGPQRSAAGKPPAGSAVPPVRAAAAAQSLRSVHAGTRPLVIGPPARNVWDSPLLLVGGGILGVVVIAFGILLYALTRGSAAELFGRAEAEYRNQAYSSAMALYEKFLKQYPDDPSASLARVRHKMAMLRQVTDDGKNPRLGLQTAKQVLPQIAHEEKFGEARSELSTILPDIADGFATQASQTTDAAKRDELARLAREALALVNEPNYVPSSLRRQREARIARIVDKLLVAERTIEQDRELATTVAAITAAAEQGDAAAAYAAHRSLVGMYPALETNGQLLAALRQVGQKERELVKVTSGGPAPLAEDHPAASAPAVLAFREGTPPADGGQAVFVLVEGAVYGLDRASGRVLWQRFVGHQATAQPLSIAMDGAADAVFLDAQRRELVRVNGAAGDLVWRLPLEGAPVGVTASDTRLIVTTRDGRVLAVDAATGRTLQTAHLPQRTHLPAAAGAVAGGGSAARLLQLGEHSTLFVLDGQSLACTETVFLGHKTGATFVPPVIVRDHVLMAESPSDDSSTLRVLAVDSTTSRLAPLGRPQRLKGRIVVPLSVSGPRVAAITDRGHIVVFEVDVAAGPDHLRTVASLEASETEPLPAYCELDRNRLFVTMRRRSLFEVQPALQQLARRFTENEDDVFLAPPQLHDDVQIVVRRRKGVAGVLVEGRRAAGVESVWTTHLAAPVVALAATKTGHQAIALTAEGRLFSVPTDHTHAAIVDRPIFSPSDRGVAIFSALPEPSDANALVWTESRAGGDVRLLDLASGSEPARIALPEQPAAAAAPLGAGVVVPMVDGPVRYLALAAGEASIAPFLPPLVPNALPQWGSPVPLADGQTCLISDGRGTVYALVRKTAPEPSLTAIGQSKLALPLVSPLVRAGATVLGVVRGEEFDSLIGFDRLAAEALPPVPLGGRVQAGPLAVGGLVLVAAEPVGLACYTADGKTRWQQPLDLGPLAGAPVATPDGDILIAFQDGTLSLLDPASGRELARQQIGQPLTGPLLVVGDHVLATGSGGVVHRAALPAKP